MVGVLYSLSGKLRVTVLMSSAKPTTRVKLETVKVSRPLPVSSLVAESQSATEPQTKSMDDEPGLMAEPQTAAEPQAA